MTGSAMSWRALSSIAARETIRAPAWVFKMMGLGCYHVAAWLYDLAASIKGD